MPKVPTSRRPSIKSERNSPEPDQLDLIQRTGGFRCIYASCEFRTLSSSALRQHLEEHRTHRIELCQVSNRPAETRELANEGHNNQVVNSGAQARNNVPPGTGGPNTGIAHPLSNSLAPALSTSFNIPLPNGLRLCVSMNATVMRGNVPVQSSPLLLPQVDGVICSTIDCASYTPGTPVGVAASTHSQRFRMDPVRGINLGLLQPSRPSVPATVRNATHQVHPLNGHSNHQMLIQQQPNIIPPGSAVNGQSQANVNAHGVAYNLPN